VQVVQDEAARAVATPEFAGVLRSSRTLDGGTGFARARPVCVTDELPTTASRCSGRERAPCPRSTRTCAGSRVPGSRC
jgi:hypothetical protein